MPRKIDSRAICQKILPTRAIAPSGPSSAFSAGAAIAINFRLTKKRLPLETNWLKFPLEKPLRGKKRYSRKWRI